MKKILLVLLLGLFAVAGWFAWKAIKQDAGHASPLACIAKDAVLVLDFKDASQFVAMVSDSNSSLTFLPSFQQVTELKKLVPEELKRPQLVLAGYEYGGKFIWALVFDDRRAKGEGGSPIANMESGKIINFRVYTQDSVLLEKLIANAPNVEGLLVNEPSFRAAGKSLSSDHPFYLYAHPSRWISWFARNWSPQWAPILYSIKSSSEWVAFDAEVGDREINLQGIAVGGGPGKIAGEGQKIQTTSLAHILPSNTIGLIHTRLAMSKPFNKELAMVVTSTAPGNNDWSDHTYLIFPDNSSARDYFNFQSVGAYRSFEILSFDKEIRSDSLEPLLPEWKTHGFAVPLSGYLVTSASREALVIYLDRYLSDNTLSHRKLYQALAGKLTESAFTLFFRPALATEFLAHKTQGVDTSDAFSAYKNLNVVALQLVNEMPGQVFYSVIAYHHRDVSEQATILWEAPLANTVENGPWKFLNHTTGDWEIVVQDADHELYLFDNRGRLLWQKKLTDKIIGELKVVDLFNNEKYQMLFTTAAAVHLVDRNGNDVEGFPITLQENATIEAARFDYSGKNEPRILVNSGNKLLNFDKHGKPVSGWKGPEVDTGLSQPVQHLLVNGKDYLVAITKANKAMFFDRAGGSRAKSLDISPARNSLVTLIKGSRFDKSYLCYADSLGRIHKHYLNGKDETYETLPLSGDVFFVCRDLFGDENLEMLCISGSQVLILDHGLNVLMDYELPLDLVSDYRLLNITPSENALGLRSKDLNEIYVVSPSKLLYQGFPLSGSSMFLLDDLDGNGRLELIVGAPNGKLTAYQFEM